MPSLAIGTHRLVTFFLVLSLCFPLPLAAQKGEEPLISNGGFLVDSGNALLGYRENDLFVPASTMKVLTCLAALDILGVSYRFSTYFYLDAKNNLYIKGSGDPLFVSETVLKIGQNLAAMGIRDLASVRLDDHAFMLHGETAGDEISAHSYDAPNGALPVNFNAFHLAIAKDGKIKSAEPQTPLLPIMKAAAGKLPPGLHRLNVNAVPGKPGISPALRLAGELMLSQWQKAGITVRHGFAPGIVPQGMPPLFTYTSDITLSELVKDCLKYSNNFIANQLFLATGMQVFGPPATWEKARRVYRSYALSVLGIAPSAISIDEGSGLSRHNQISPSAMLQILEHFKPHADLLSRKHDLLMKSGTLRDAFCYVGYFEKANTLRPFAIFLNQAQNSRNRVLAALQKHIGVQTTVPLP